jgi:hypothetical protein
MKNRDLYSVMASAVRTIKEYRMNRNVAIWARKMFGPVKENDVRRICTNQKVMDVCSEPDIISEIRKAILRRLGYVERRPDDRSVRRVLKNIQEGKSSVGKPRKILKIT